MTANTRLGPPNFDKIALLGSAVSSVHLAPFDDPSWAIWVCSPGAFGMVASKRSDVWFETHRFQPSEPGKFGAAGTKPYFSPEFHQFLIQYPGPVFMAEEYPGIPNVQRIPFERLIEKFGPYFFTSSVAWMLALAIEQGPKSIGLWGIDMSATEEYAYQRHACQHFVGMARGLGIDVVLPPESDLMRPPTMYGYCEHNPRYIKLNTRLEQFHKDRGAIRQQIDQLRMADAQVSGAIDDCTYVLQTWSDDVPAPNPAHAMSFAGKFAAKPGPPVAETVLDQPPASTGADVRKIVEA